jgi:hypothetical protein
MNETINEITPVLILPPNTQITDNNNTSSKKESNPKNITKCNNRKDNKNHTYITKGSYLYINLSNFVFF